MICPQCSSEVPDGSNFCGFCGTRLDSGGVAYTAALVHEAAPTASSLVEKRAREAADAFAGALGVRLGAIMSKREKLVAELDAERMEIVQTAQDESNAHLSKSLQVVNETAEALAPKGSLAASVEGKLDITAMAEYLQLGSVDVPQVGHCPVLVPFFGSGHVMIEGEFEACGPLIRETLWQIASRTRPDELEVVVYNPRASAVLAPFANLPNIRIVADSRGLEDAVSEMKLESIEVSNAMGDPNANLVDYRKAAGSDLGCMRALVLLDYPERLDARVARGIEDLIEHGAASGISLVVHFPADLRNRVEQDESSLRWFDESRYQVNSEWFVVDADGVVHWDRFGEFSMSLPSRDNATIVSAASAWSAALEEAERLHRQREEEEAAKQAERMIKALPLEERPEEVWTGNTKDGIVLATIESNGHVDDYEVKLNDDCVHAILLGGTGSGKSVFILSLIYGMSQRYAPTELLFFALDFKEGLSMATLAPNNDRDGYLPHARILGVNSDRRFGVEVLQVIIGECQRRSELFKQAGVQKISDYRDKGYQMPRIVLIIDEFQLLFQGGDDIARQAGDDIEFIARQGRSAGIHMILATQTLSGLVRDTTFKKDIMLQQMKIRMCLSSDLLDQILVDVHTAKNTILKKYEVLINDNSGLAGSNHVAKVLPAEDDVLDALQDEWTDWQVGQYGKRFEPMIFDGALRCVFADVAEALLSLRAEAASRPFASAVLGKRISLAGSRFATVELASNMVVVGRASVKPQNDDGFLVDIMGAMANGPTKSNSEANETVVGIMQMAGVSLAFQDPHATFLVFNGMNSVVAEDAHMGDWIYFMQQGMGADLRVIDRGNMVAMLKELVEAITGVDGHFEENVYLLGFDLGNIYELAQDALDSSGKKLLSTVMKLGPAHGVHSVIWWSDVQGIKSNFGSMIDSAIRFSASVLLDVYEGDLPSAIPKEGGLAKWRGEENRALVCDGVSSKGDLIIPVVPCDAAGYSAFTKRLLRGGR